MAKGPGGCRGRTAEQEDDRQRRRGARSRAGLGWLVDGAQGTTPVQGRPQQPSGPLFGVVAVPQSGWSALPEADPAIRDPTAHVPFQEEPQVLNRQALNTFCDVGMWDPDKGPTGAGQSARRGNMPGEKAAFNRPPPGHGTWRGGPDPTGHLAEADHSRRGQRTSKALYGPAVRIDIPPPHSGERPGVTDGR